MTSSPEYFEVESPFIEQLIAMGWTFTTGNLDYPSATGRESFYEALVEDDLRKALVRINLDDAGQAWLDEARINQAISAIQRLGACNLMEANQAATHVLLSGIAVEGIPEWDGGRSRTIRFIDWQHVENNTFRVINQFKVECPSRQVQHHIIPDLVLFVNGIPLVVVECKSPYLASPMEEAIDQLQRYSNRRTWVEDNEGNERLFFTNQFLIATCFERATVGTISAGSEHYLEWKDTSPRPMSEVAAALNKDSLSSQETLVAGMLDPATLLDIVRHFILFKTDGGRTFKIVARYQQYRAVHHAVERLLHGDARAQDGEHDRRGGIIWHTQGSGKSFTMVFLVRKMRSLPALRRFKVVVVTDRKDLQKQLSETTALSGEMVSVARNTATLKRLLAVKGPDLVFATIQKYQERDSDAEDETADDEAIRDSELDVGEFPVLNEDDSILVLVDEAHRSHSSALHANLLKSLPNCARIGFTGTPIIMGAKKRTHEIFGEFIDRYTIRQSELDKSTVPILYEGRTAEGAVTAGRNLDQLFEDMFREWKPQGLEALKRKYATKGHVMEADRLIAAKASDMLRHYVENIMPNGFKAQLVAVSRRAAIKYYEALRKARDTLVGQIEALDPHLATLTGEDVDRLDMETRFLRRMHAYLETIKELEFTPVISGSHNDDATWAEWTDRAKINTRIDRFKLPLYHDDPKHRDPLAFLIVKSMLLTGFDAPVEQVMYLDRPIKEAELLQAIARVNRTYDEKKTAGIVVDYFGVAGHLKEALAVYSAEDVEGMLQSIRDEIPKLRDRHLRVLQLFSSRGIDDLTDRESCVRILGDDKLRAEFQVKLKQFLSTLDLVLPRPEGIPYVRAAKALGEIQLRARNRYRGDERPLGKDIGEKVRKLIDEHVISLGLDPRIPPIVITDVRFDEHVSKHLSNRTKASEMEHALRYHIRKHIDEDPEYFQKLSERLKSILTEFKNHWDAQVLALQKLVNDIREGRQRDDTGLDPVTQAPFLGILKQELEGSGKLSSEELIRLCRITIELVEHLKREIRLVGFWRNAYAQEVLRNWVIQFLDDKDLLKYESLPRIADRIVDLAKVNHHKLCQ